MEIQHTQTVQAEMEYLLTREAYFKWASDLDNDVWASILLREGKLLPTYLREHGLPLDSEIKGL